jgi:RNA 2',3'-cyclic 3'-phosphodiesterase
MEQRNREIRSFIAVELPEVVKSFLNGICSDLMRCGGDVKWVRPEGMHLTLKFLGNVREELIPAIESRLKSVLAEEAPMDMELRGVGAFPGLGKPRVVWAGLRDRSGRLAPLAARMEETLARLGFEPEKRPFSPHLTLGRVRSQIRSRDLVDAIRTKLDLAGPAFVADRVVFFESILKPSGAEYRPICSYKLGESSAG